MIAPSIHRLSLNGLSLFVRVTPNAGRETIEGVEMRDDGQAVLRVRVKAVADKGRANAAVVALIAKSLGVPKSAVTIAAGETARIKTLAITGDGAALAEVLDRLTGTNGR